MERRGYGSTTAMGGGRGDRVEMDLLDPGMGVSPCFVRIRNTGGGLGGRRLSRGGGGDRPPRVACHPPAHTSLDNMRSSDSSTQAERPPQCSKSVQTEAKPNPGSASSPTRRLYRLFRLVLLAVVILAPAFVVSRYDWTLNDSMPFVVKKEASTVERMFHRWSDYKQQFIHIFNQLNPMDVLI